MKKDRRGGAHLDKNLSPKTASPAREKTGSAQSGHDPAADSAPILGLSRNRKIILISAVVLAALVILAALGMMVWDDLNKEGGLLDGLPSVPGYSDNVDATIDGPIRSEADSKRKEEFYTFLVVGRDTGGGGNTDTIMFCSYDIPNQKLNVMSIPRDTIVDARHPDKNKQINGVWNLGLYYAEKGSTKKGVDYLKEAVGDMTGIYPDFYVVVNWEAFGRLVDAIGGVDFEVPFDMKYKDPTQNLVIDQPGGYRHLSGDDAMQVVRWRHNNSFSVQYADADLGRIRTQQALMKEIIKKCLRIENITKITEFAEIFADEVETDLSVGNLLAFAQRAIFGGLDVDNVTFMTMPNRAANNGRVQANPEELLGVLNESFNPYLKDLDMSELRILQRGSNGYYVYQGTGTGTAPTHSSTDPKPAQAATSKPSAAPSAAPSEEPGEDPDQSPEPSAKPSASPEPSASDEPSQPPEVETSQAPEPSQTPEATPEPPPSRDPADMGIPMD